MRRTSFSLQQTACAAAVLLAMSLAIAARGDGEGAGAGVREREALPIGTPVSGAGGAAGGAGTPSTLRTVGSLGVVVILIAGAGFGIRTLARMGVGKTLGAGAGAPSGVVEVLARYPAGRGLTLTVLKIDRRVLLLGQVATTTGRVESVSTLTTFDDADEVASILMKTQDEQGQSISAKFREVLSGFHTARHPHAEHDGSDDSHAADDHAVRSSTYSPDGDEVALVDERGAVSAGNAGTSLGAFKRSVGSLRRGGRA